MTHVRMRRAVAFVALCLSLFVINVKTADATHFLGGSLYWEVDPTFVSPTHVRYRVTLEANWRRDFVQWNPINPAVGVLFDNGIYRLQVSGTSFSQLVPIRQRAISVNAAGNWMVAQSEPIVLDIPKTALPVTMVFTACCRDSTLKEGNNDKDWTILSVLPNNPAITRSPRSTMLPRVFLQENMPVTMLMPTVAYDGLTNIVELASAAESDLVTIRPVGKAGVLPTGCTGANCNVCATLPSSYAVCAAAMTVTPAGQINWTPQDIGEYAVQFKITSVDAGGVRKVSTAFDLVFEVLENCPTCGQSPFFDPAPVSSTSVVAGFETTVPFVVKDSDLPAQALSVATTALPAGAVVEVLSNPQISPMSARLRWTPSAGQVGVHTVCFQAIDSTSRSSFGQPCTAITVLPNQSPVLTCQPASPVNATSPAGAWASVFATTLDPEGGSQSVTWRVDGAHITTDPVPPSTVPVPLSMSRVYAIGTYMVQLIANDGVSPPATCSFNVVVNRIPQTITFTPPASVPLGAPPLVLTATSSSNLPVDSFQLLSGPATLTGNVLAFTGLGVVEVKALHPGDATYAPAEAMAMIHVKDMTPPTIAPHGNESAEATSSSGAVVGYAPPTFTDNVDDPGTASCSPGPGSQFPLGPTVVNCTATDAAGNSSSSSFLVNVVDTTAPQVSFSGNAGTYAIGQTVNITCAATDAVGVTSTDCANISQPAYSFGLGSHTLTATASDAAGNTGSASTSFTVTATLTDLQDLVSSFCSSGAAGGMNAKLAAAASAPNANARRGQLDAFANQVAAQTGNCLTSSQAALLLQLAQTFY